MRSKNERAILTIMKKGMSIWLIVAAVIIVVVGLALVGRAMPGKYDDLAQCLTDKEVTFYGAFWCPHCQEQKRVFGNSAKLLPYVECSEADGKTQTQACIDAEIQSYPTWEFADGSRLTNVQSPAALAEKAGCPLP
jgi:thiol-disulfide isomerase/thioredoxin